MLSEILTGIIEQLQSPTLAFLLVGMVAAAFKTQLRIPDAIYQFCVFMLLMRIGLNAGLELRGVNIAEVLLPAIICIVLGIGIVFLSSGTLARFPGVKKDDALATGGLFGAVSGATMVAGMLALEEAGIAVEGWIATLYPFMDTPALVTAIVLASIYTKNMGNNGNGNNKPQIWPIIRESLQGPAVTALAIGFLLGAVTRPERVFETFYDPLFRGFLSVLMLALGIEAYERLKDLSRVAHWYAVYALVSPIVHGFMGFGLGYIAHLLVGLSPGGVIMLAVLAASNSDISGPPTLRVGIPTANPSAYIGASTAIGTPVAITVCIPLFIALAVAVFGL
jgi:hypothetical protein